MGMSEKYERLTTCSEITPETDMKQEMGYSHIYKRLAAYEASGLSPARVMELAEAERDGRLVVLPYKAGEVVYFPYSVDCCECRNHNECEHVGGECADCYCEVCECEVDTISVIQDGDGGMLDINDIYWFDLDELYCMKRTRAEAEKALKNREGS